jgi:DNA-binding PadR family transcriptional regulator
MTPTHRERQIMQHLRGGAWVKAFTLESPTTIENLLAKGWIESRGTGHEKAYRLTSKGLEAKKAPLRIYS